MLIYNFDKCKLDNNNKVKGIYLNITDNNYPEKNPQINYYTEIELDKEPAPDEAILSKINYWKRRNCQYKVSNYIA